MFNFDANIFSVRIHKQHWRQTKFSYMSAPRPNCGFMIAVDGEIDFVSAAGTICAKSGDIIFLPKNSRYDAIFRTELGSVDDYLINFETDISFSDYTVPTLISHNESIRHSELFKSFIGESFNAERSNFRIKGMLFLLIDTILNENTEISKNNETLNKAKKLLQSGENLSIGEVALRCCVSESGLRKIFKESMGISPAQYRINERLNRARYLLESTDKSMEEISDELNFFDTAYFCKVFRKYIGVSPGKYARNKKM